MPPKNKKGAETEDLGLMKAARFGRVKNTVRELWFHRLLHSNRFAMKAFCHLFF